MEYASKFEISSRLENSRKFEKPSRHWIGLCQLWFHRHRTRKQLHELLHRDPQRLHHDLGLSTEAAQAEINKPFWR